MRKSMFLKIALRYSYWFLIQIIMAFLVTQIVVEGNRMIAEMVDTLLSGGEVEFKNYVQKLVIMILLGVAATFMKSFSSNMFSIHVQTEFKNKAAEKLLRLEYRYFDEKGSGSIMNKLVSDISQAGQFFSETLPDLAVCVVSVGTVMVYIFQVNIKVMIVVLIFYPVLFVIANYISKKLMLLAKKRRGIYDEMAEVASDGLNGIVVGRSYNLYDTIVKRLYSVIEAVLKNEYSRTRIATTSWILQSVITWLPSIVCTLFALYEVLNGRMTAGDMLAFTILLKRIVKPLSYIPFLFNDSREMGVSIKRLEELIAQPEEQSGTGVFLPMDTAPVLELSDIYFSYNEERIIFDHLNLTVEAGKTTALVGGSGEGKTTVFKILCGLYKAQKGVYKIYGQDFKEWDIQAVREQFALVSQNVFLFPDTIAVNVLHGRKGASFEEIEEACRSANIHEFIMRLPKGYDTLVGERGVRLSGGERQRISIARAFLKNAPILLLDEPTSAVDVETEALIKQAITRISEGKTVIVIAHRLNTIEHADRILVFSKGRIAEEGTHEQLLDRNGIYAGLYGEERRELINEE